MNFSKLALPLVSALAGTKITSAINHDEQCCGPRGRDCSCRCFDTCGEDGTWRPNINPPMCYSDHSLWKDYEHGQPIARKLDTVHLKDLGNAGTIPRDEVVQALQDAFVSEDNFIVESTIGDHTHVVDITRNEMDVKPPHSDLGDYSGGFQVTNKFVVGSDNKYLVNCPAAASDDVCVVTEVVHSNGVDCRVKKEVALAYEDIPSKCLGQMYKMRLQAVGAHFFLVNVKEDASADGCPPNVILTSSEGVKWKSVLRDAEELPKIELGVATLGDILKAEQDAEPLDNSKYDLTQKNCAHYAQRIWRHLGLKETEGLATFLIDNIVGSNQLETIFKNHREAGGLRALAAIAMGKDSLEVYIEGVVYSQLDL